ncbi:MAG: hypothetical protein LBH43_12645 [Treponema sp.]|jgi:hypothetical protein|nr:hypothetical protein [Treponema sp.]
MEFLSLDKALSKIFSADTDLLKNDKNEYLKKVHEMSGSEYNQEIDMLYSILCEEVIEILYQIYDFNKKTEFKINSSYGRTKRGVQNITEILIEEGIRADVIADKYMFNIFSIIGLDVKGLLGNMADEINGSSKITYDITVKLAPQKNGKRNDRKEKKANKEKEPNFPEQKAFYISFGIIMFSWSLCFCAALITMVVQAINDMSQVAQEQTTNSLIHGGLNYLLNGGIIALLFIGAKVILPLLKESFNRSVEVRNEYQIIKYLIKRKEN